MELRNELVELLKKHGVPEAVLAELRTAAQPVDALELAEIAAEYGDAELTEFSQSLRLVP